MKMQKEFDCVQMKDAIQRRLQRRRQGMSTHEFIADMRKSIADSQSPVALWWRRLEKRQAESTRETTLAR